MQEFLYDSEYALVSFDSTAQCIELTWKKAAGSEEYRKVFGCMVDFSNKNKIRCMLSDMRNEGVVRPEDLQWLAKEVLTRAVQQKLQRIALIIKESIFASVYAETIKRKLDDSPVRLQIFDNIPEAKAWLLDE